MQRIDSPTLNAVLTAGAPVFDTRPPGIVAMDGLPGVRALDVEELRAGRLPDIPPDEPVYLVCERGQISELAGLYLEAAGFTQVYNLTGGMKAWREWQRQEECSGQ